MSTTTKITDLPVLTTPSANGANTVFVVVDKSSGTFTTKQLTLANLDIAIDNVASFAYTTANAAFDKANSANVVAQAGFDKANSANVLAQNAYNAANSANTFDYTTISTTSGVYGNATHIAVVSVAANGRVLSVTNTAITGFANATYDQAGFDKANSANVLAQAAFDTANTGSTTATAAFNKANSANVIAQAGWDQANTANTSALAAFSQANSANVLAQAAFDAANTANAPFAQAAFDKANSANVLAQAAFDTANTANTSDYTTISITAGSHGNGTFVPVITLTANGRVSAISNTAITGFANSTYATAAFDKANTANTTADAGFAKANAANVLAQAAYDYANTISGASGSFISWVGNTANSAFAHANGSFVTSNSALSLSALAFNQANTGVISAQAAFDKANASNTLAQTARDAANTANTTANIVTSAFSQANAAYDKANSANVLAQAGYTQANTATTLAQAAYDAANTANTSAAASAFNKANTASNTAESAFAHANSAYDVANTALTTAAIAINFDNQANAAYDQANTATTLAQNAYNASNSANVWANTVVLTTAQAAFDRSNTNLTSIDTINPRLNSAFNQANTANTRAYASVQKSGDTMTGALVITTNASIGFTVTSNTSNAVAGATNPVVEMTGKANNYIQTYLFNETNEKYSSADFVAYPHNGNDANGWIDVGITSLSFDYPTFSITGGNEGYIFMSAPGGSSTTGNLVIATDSTGSQNAIEFYVGGFAQDKANAKVIIGTSGFIANGNVRLTATSVPATSIGVSGDNEGLIAFNNTHIYYCSAAYDGTTNVWRRLAWSGDTW